jgi:hypothetical protein
LKTENNFLNKHFICLSSLFVLGNGVITAPSANANEYNFLAFLISSVLAVVVAVVFFIIPLNRLTSLFFIIFGFYVFGDTFIDFIKFIKNNLLPDTPPFLIVLPFVLILVYAAFKRVELLLKFALICFFAVVGVILLFFLATLKDFNIKNIFIYQMPKMTVVFEQILPYLKTVTLPVGLLPILAKTNGIKKSANIIGVAVGCLLFGVCILNSVLLFGFPFASVLDYPYSSAGSTVTFGNLFTRMDGLLYFVYLASSFVKCIVGIEIIKKSRNLFAP